MGWIPTIPIDAHGCWIWRAARNAQGYGVCWNGRSTQLAHRWVYEQIVGPIPDGLELDHLCRVRACVNPDHLEPVTHAENVRRSPSANAAKERCPQGHDYSDENTYEWRGRRQCRTCSREHKRRYKERTRAAA